MDDLTKRLVRIAKAHRDIQEAGPYLDWINKVLDEVLNVEWEPPSISPPVGQKVLLGELHDVSEMSQLVGFEKPVYVTADMWATIGNIPPSVGQTVQDRVVEVVIHARRASILGIEKFVIPIRHGKRKSAQARLEQSDECWTIILRGQFRYDGGKPLPD